MKVIMRQNFEELGLEGDIVEVAGGYGRNYLIPRGFALEATPQNIKRFELIRKKIEFRRVKAKEDAEKLKQEVEGLVITLAQKAGEEGKLYGSVTGMDIAAALENAGYVIDRRKIVLEKPIKKLGEYEVPVKIYPGVTGSIKTVVVSKEEKEG
ncbi:MAG: 50S ribosomal protein L9 [Desulfatiglandaceae bacterium]